jgi:hypothetical protein
MTVEVGQKDWYKSCKGLVLLSLWSPPPLARRCGTISSVEYLVPQAFVARGNWVVSIFVGP